MARRVSAGACLLFAVSCASVCGPVLGNFHFSPIHDKTRWGWMISGAVGGVGAGAAGAVNGAAAAAAAAVTCMYDRTVPSAIVLDSNLDRATQRIFSSMIRHLKWRGDEPPHGGRRFSTLFSGQYLRSTIITSRRVRYGGYDRGCRSLYACGCITPGRSVCNNRVIANFEQPRSENKQQDRCSRTPHVRNT